MTYICSKDSSHASDDPEFCSICGARIAADPSGSPFGIAAPVGAEVCPDCGSPRVGTAVFCEVCRYNFDLQQSFRASAIPAGVASPSVATPAPDPALAATVPATGGVPPAGPTFVGDRRVRFDAVVKVDPSLNTHPDPATPCPVNEPERVFPLDFSENLIGRRSEKRGIFPEVTLFDPGISHRHAKILIEPGGPALLDIGSTNGTQLNGCDVPANVKTPLKSGDSITLGCWTRIEIRER